jgi:hypothetical protein
MTADPVRRRVLTRAEVEEMADAIAALLADPGAGLSPVARARWEGALTAVEVVLGRAPTVAGNEIGAEVRRLL